MKFIFLFFISATSFAAVTDYKKDCLIAQKYVNEPDLTARVNLPEWVKAQAEQIGLTPLVLGDDGFAVELGTRQYVLLVQGAMENCDVIGAMLGSLQKLKNHDPAIEGMVFVFGKPAVVKNIVVLKEYNINQNESLNINKLVNEWIAYDQNPKKVVDIGALFKQLSKSISKIKKDLKKIIDSDDIVKFELEIQKTQFEAEKWDISKQVFLKAKLNELNDKKSIEQMNSNVLDFANYIKLHDEVRRGLWEKANETMTKINSPSLKLKAALEKGRGNIEGVLKVIKADTLVVENEVRQTFKESKEVLSNVP